MKIFTEGNPANGALSEQEAIAMAKAMIAARYDTRRYAGRPPVATSAVRWRYVYVPVVEGDHRDGDLVLDDE